MGEKRNRGKGGGDFNYNFFLLLMQCIFLVLLGQVWNVEAHSLITSMSFSAVLFRNLKK